MKLGFLVIICYTSVVVEKKKREIPKILSYNMLKKLRVLHTGVQVVVLG